MSDYQAAVNYANSFNGKSNGGANRVMADQYAAATKTAKDRDALSYIKQVLAQFGLGTSDTLANWAWGEIQKGTDPKTLVLDLYKQPDFQARFPAIEERRRAGLPPVSPKEYLLYESQAHDLFRAAGLPPEFLTKDAVHQLIASDVSPVELQARIKNGYEKVQQAPQDVRDAMRSYFGVNGDQALATYFLDPKASLPILEQQARMAAVAGEGHAVLGQWIDKGRAEQMAQAGYDWAGAKTGFDHLASIAPLFQATISENPDAVTLGKQGLAAEFGIGPQQPKPADFPVGVGGGTARTGTPPASGAQGATIGMPPTDTAAAHFNWNPEPGSKAEAMQQIETRRESRVEAFKGGGGAAVVKEGETGLGSGPGT